MSERLPIDTRRILKRLERAGATITKPNRTGGGCIEHPSLPRRYRFTVHRKDASRVLIHALRRIEKAMQEEAAHERG